MGLELNLVDVPMGVRRSLAAMCSEENAREVVKALDRQQRIARWFHQNRPRAVEGLGGQEMAMDPYFRQYFKMRHGSDPIDDAHLQRFVRRRNPELNVRSTGTRIQVGPGDGLAHRSSFAMPRTPTFHKVYKT